MPPIPKVSAEELLPLLLAAEGAIDQDGRIPGPRHKVWMEISSALEDRITPNYVYQRVKENRHNLYEELCRHHGVEKASAEETDNVFQEEPASPVQVSSSEEDAGCEEVRPKKTFRVLFSVSDWKSLQPIQTTYKRKDRSGGIRRVTILPPYKWEDTLIEMLWDQHKIPCPYSFIKGQVSTDSAHRDQYIKVSAHCSECGAQAVGRIMTEPTEGEGVIMTWRAEDTRGLPHNRKRYLTRVRREVVGKDTAASSSSMFRREQAAALMDDGDVEPPHLYKGHVLRKAKQEYKDKSALGLVHGPDPLVCLEMMKHRQPHCGSLHDIGQDRFFLHYWTPSQLHVYKTFCARRYIVLELDATGTLVRKILRINGPSSHIFLYEGIMNNGETRIPVVQMLSERQDANSILFWLNAWESGGAPHPKEVVVDNSPALKAALARSFGRSADIAEYKHKCFLVLYGASTVLPPCYIRLDLAHLMNAAKNWEAWRDKTIRRLRSFYLHCLGLLVVARTLEDFAAILTHILTVALSKTEGVDENGDQVLMEESLQFLRQKIRGEDLLSEDVDQDVEEDKGKRLPDCDELPTDQETPSSIKDFIVGIKAKAEIRSKTTGERINPYFSVEVADNFLNLSSDFTLFAAVMVPLFKSPYSTATTAGVESEFNDLKTNVLRGETAPMLVHKFVDKHLSSINGICRIQQGSLQASQLPLDILPSPKKTNLDPVTERETTPINHSEEDPDDPGDDEESAPCDLNHLENWRGKADTAAPRRKRSKYTVPFPELDLAMQCSRIKPPTKRLLRNGNFTGAVVMDSSTNILVRNTCAFDVLRTLVSNAYIELQSYRAFADDSKNLLVQAGKSLATLGAVQETYKLRAKAIASLLSPARSLPMPASRSRARDSIVCLEYDAWASVTTIAHDSLTDAPSVSFKVDCVCERPKEGSIPVLDTNCRTVCKNGLTSLTEAIADCLALKPSSDIKEIEEEAELSHCTAPCLGKPKRILSGGQHMFIDLSFLGSKLPISGEENNRSYRLDEIPVRLRIAGVDYALMGAVGFRPGHYVAYIRRLATSTWDLHDGLARKELQNVSAKVEILPHILFYVALPVPSK